VNLVVFVALKLEPSRRRRMVLRFTKDLFRRIVRALWEPGSNRKNAPLYF